MNIIQIDLKTGKVLQQTNPETLVLEPKLKSVKHSYLETWLNHHGLNEAQFYVADFYDGVVDQDRQRLEEDGKILVFTNGKKGYFTDRDTSKLMTEGDRSIYAANDNSAHYGVAYGSLIASDGIASTLRSDCKILVVDDERRSAGIEIEDLDHLLNKMGDGTMLVSDAVIRSLLTEEDTNLDPHNLVTQFRAASLDFPGIAKGTLTHSQWCDYLGVDAIVSRSDIKGDDGRFSTVGIHEVETFWINRKADAEYGLQSVGPQVKGCIPEATLQEFNPMMKAKAEKLAAIATDPVALMKYYAEKKRDEILSEGESIEENPDRPKVDWLKELAAADQHGQLAGFKRVNTKLERFLKGERKDLALRGIEVPSATAQHHSALKPWEIANRNLPQGAIVAYYRSPFPNVGAAAIAVNNIRSLRWNDPESYDKQGVIFLNPWTAKNIAITDFDGNRLGDSIDIHCGGGDLTFPHHENEIAQSEAVTGQQLATYWMHNGMVNVGGVKMSKSLGNFTTIRDLLDKGHIEPMAMRFFVLGAQYRKPIDFTEEAMTAATNGWHTLQDAMGFSDVGTAKLGWVLDSSWDLDQNFSDRPLDQLDSAAIESFKLAMDDDFNTASALAVLFDLAKGINREANQLIHQGTIDVEAQALLTTWKTLLVLSSILGLQGEKVESTTATLSPEAIEAAIAKRSAAKAAKDFKTADQVRNELKEQGILLVDQPGGITTWHFEA